MKRKSSSSSSSSKSENDNNISDGFSDKQEKTLEKKGGRRRRVQTNRPYKDIRLMNTAEARREIVTALKLHRANMKAKQQLKAGPEYQPFEPDFSSQQFSEADKLKSRRNPRIYASNSSISDNFAANYVKNLVYPPGPENQPFGPDSSSQQLSQQFFSEQEADKLKSRRNPRIYTSNSFISDNFVYPPGFYSPYSWPVFVQENENLDFAVLPRRTLGLNLNFQDFNNLERNSVYSTTNPSSIYSSSSPSITSSSSPGFSTSFGPDSGLSPGFDDYKETAENRAIENHQQQIQLKDSLKSMEIGPEDDIQKNEDFVSSLFDEVMEFPAWINANDESCLQDVNDLCSGEYFQDIPALPCMDIEEIEEMDGDWLV